MFLGLFAAHVFTDILATGMTFPCILVAF